MDNKFIDTSRSLGFTDPITTSKSKHSMDEFSPSSIREQVSITGSLVAYNSSDEEHVRLQPRASSTRDYKARHRDRGSGLPAKEDTPKKSLACHSHPCSNVIESKAVTLESEVKVVKTTAKSGWDSSDSDFETPGTTNRTGRYSAHSGNSVSISASAGPTSSVSGHPNRKHNFSKSRKRLKERSSSNKSAHPDKGNSGCHRSGSERCQLVESSLDKPVRSKRRKRGHSQRRCDRSNSSRDSHQSQSEPDVTAVSRRGNSDLSDDNHRAPSSSQLSSHTSRSGSHFSSASSTSSRWRSSHRHRRHSHGRRRSKSYTSDSSSRASSHASRFAYRDRSRSTSRRSRRRRRTRSYRRHYRRRSYSSSSRSRSHSWVSSDTSSRSSYHSSRSSVSRASANSRRRSSAARRTPSPQIAMRRKPTSGNRVHDSNDSARTASPERRPVRLTSNSSSHTKASESSRSNTTSITSAYTFGSLSNVAETVSAAVKRVTGGNSTNSRYHKTLGNKSPRLPVALTKSDDDESPHQPPVTTSSGTLIDIPLPKDSTRNENARQTESMPYIGPQANALTNQMQRQQFINSVAQMSTPQIMARSVGITAPISTAVAVSKPSIYETSTLPAVFVPTQLSQQFQQTQLQQVLQAAAAFQAAQGNGAASVQASSNPSAITSQLLQHLNNQQPQKSPVIGVAPNNITASILAAHQQKLLAQLQRQAMGNQTVDHLSRSNMDELIPAIGSLPAGADANSILSADRLNSASALTAALLRARATNTIVPGLPLASFNVNATQSNTNQLIALLTAAQQQQHQQVLASSMRLSTTPTQAAVASVFPQDANARFDCSVLLPPVY
ncbi:hypothetical protein D915_002316 [Fasciola hepatica]|uniref:Uncharacterized protein n=1 Tax=Fasciola hepatica TaxID=6192 RepID=A0A4E0RXT0_FASHE|nr:hypothetical protein D915_002316 [Fasciola hepatica]